MAMSSPATGEGPVAYTDVDGGLHLIPLSALRYDESGALKPEAWPLYAANKAGVDLLLARLQAEGALRKGEAPAAPPALTLTAVGAGSSRVAIDIAITKVVPDAVSPPASLADVTVTETDTYAGLNLAALVAQLGAAAGAGSAPGMAFVSGPAPSVLPEAGTYAFAPPAPGAPATAAIAKAGGGVAFTLQARSGSADGALIVATVGDVDAAAKTFSLTLVWTKSVTGRAISALAADFAFVVTIAAPAGGYRAPAVGEITLVGGADTIVQPAVKASATVLASV